MLEAPLIIYSAATANDLIVWDLSAPCRKSIACTTANKSYVHITCEK